MISNIDKILLRIKRHKKDADRLYYLSKDFKIPFDIVYGIYLIETTFRPFYYRIAEYVIVFLALLRAVLFHTPIKNFTVGKSQIGIGAILLFWGHSNANFYTKQIHNVTLRQAIDILKSFAWRYNSIIFVWRLNILYKNCAFDDYRVVIRNIGNAYNGRMIYGYVLEELITKHASNWAEIEASGDLRHNRVDIIKGHYVRR